MRVLFLTHRVPYAPNRGDRLRALHIARSLAASTDLELVSLAHDRRELEQAATLEALGIRVTAIQVPRLANLVNGALRLAGNRPLTHVLLDAPQLTRTLADIVQKRPPDVVLAYCSGMARFALEPTLAAFPLVVDFVDVDSQKWLALSQSARWPKRWIFRREARHLADFERRVADVASATFVVNERERALMLRVAPDSNVGVMEVGVDREPLWPRTPPEERPRLVFCGVMNYQPNIDGMLWFCRSVWPAVRAHYPDAHFSIVGSDPAPAIRRLNAPALGIEVTGTVDDVRPHLWASAIAIAPLQTARGVQTKVLEAVAAGLPAVVTPQVFDGLPRAIHSACRVGSSPEEYAAQILALFALPGAVRRRIAEDADIAQLGWEAQLRPLHDALSAATLQTKSIAV